MSANILEVLRAAFEGDKSTRTAATEQLTAVMNSPEALQYLFQLLDAGMDSSVPAAQSLAALIYAKNSLLHTIPDSILESQPEAMSAIQQKLLHGIFVVPESHRKIIQDCIATLVSGFNWNYLGEVIPLAIRIKECEAAAPPPILEYAIALMELIYTYVKRFKTVALSAPEEKVEVIFALVDVLPLFITVYQDFFLTRLVLKVMECLIEAGLQCSSPTDRLHFPDGAMFDDWWVVMQKFLNSHITIDADNASNTFFSFPRCEKTGRVNGQFVLCVKRIGIIAYNVLSHATIEKKPVPFAAHFILKKKRVINKKNITSIPSDGVNSLGYSFMILFETWIRSCLLLRSPVNGVLQGNEDTALCRKSEIVALRYLKVCTLEESFYRHHILPNALPLIETLFLPYLYYNEEDDEIISDGDLTEYSKYIFQQTFNDGEFSPRQAASNAILTFIGGKKAFHAGAALLQPLVQALDAELRLEDNDASMPRIFCGLHLLSIIRKHLRADRNIWEHQMHTVLAQLVAPRISPGRPIAIRAKGIAVCQRYAKAPMPSEEVFGSFVEMILQTVDDSDARIRLSGLNVIATLLGMSRAHPYLLPRLLKIVEQCLEFIPKIRAPFLSSVLLEVATNFAPEIAPIIDSITQILVQEFLAQAFDLGAMENMMQAESKDETLMMYDFMASGAETMLYCLTMVLNASEHNPLAVKKVTPDFLRLIRSVIQQPDCYDYLEQILDIFQSLARFTSPDIPQEIYDMLPLVFELIKSGSGVDFFSTIEMLLDNIISASPAIYCQNVPLMEHTLEACDKMLNGNVAATEECVVAAPQLLEALLHQAKSPSSPPNLLTSYIPRILHILLTYLLQREEDASNSSDLSIRIWVLAALMDCFYYDAGSSLRVIIEAGGATLFFQGFFSFFRGCIPHLFPPQQTTEVKKKGKKSKKVSDEAQDLKDNLSLLTRKVIILGLSSLLGFLAELPSDGVDPSFLEFRETFSTKFSSYAVALVEFCILENAAAYNSRCEVFEKVLSGAAEADDEYADTDTDDDETLGVALGGDGIDDDLDDIENDGSEDGVALRKLPLEEYDEMDEYQSPIDDINEVEFFVRAIQAQKGSWGLAGITKTVSEYEEAANVASRHRQLTLAMEADQEKDYKQRHENFVQAVSSSSP